MVVVDSLSPPTEPTEPLLLARDLTFSFSLVSLSVSVEVEVEVEGPVREKRTVCLCCDSYLYKSVNVNVNVNCRVNQKDVRVIISMMVMCNATVITEYDRRISRLSNAQLDVQYGNNITKE